jgi:hypothetical protein
MLVVGRFVLVRSVVAGAQQDMKPMKGAGIGPSKNRSAMLAGVKERVVEVSRGYIYGFKAQKNGTNSKPSFFECVVLSGRMNLLLCLRVKVSLSGGLMECSIWRKRNCHSH